MILADLHSHTRASHDGFTGRGEMLLACLNRGVNVIAVTEHDLVCDLDLAEFKKNGVILVPGCEFTCENGSHIIGIFIKKSLKSGSTRNEIFNHIESQGGIIIIPHPFKPESGYFQYYQPDSFLNRVTFLELINGGWNSIDYEESIKKIALEYHIKLIASSDSHKIQHVGMCVTRLNCKFPEDENDLKNTFRKIEQGDIELLIDDSIDTKYINKNANFKKNTLYQFFLKITPYKIRRRIKLVKYGFQSKRLKTQHKYRVYLNE